MFHSKCRKCVNEIANKADKKRTEINPAYKFMDSISKCIHEMLKSQKSIDNKTSCRKYVPFTKGQLIKHFEELFLHPDNLLLNGNPWMTFQNRGNYRKDFSEEDPSTWTWHIDHIVPQAKLKFDSYDHPNFLKCWSLENLRPLRADLNMKKGDRISY